MAKSKLRTRGSSKSRDMTPDSVKLVLCATDLSPISQNAVSVAAEVAQAYNAKLLVVHVIEILDPRYDFVVKDIAGKLIREAREKVKAELPHLHAQKAVPIEVLIKKGHPADEVLKVIKEREPSLLVVGAHYGQKHQKQKLGRIADKLLRLSPVPVLVSRPMKGDDIETIVCAVDGSPCSVTALKWAIGAAQKEFLDTVTLLNAYEVPTGYIEAGMTYEVAASKMKKWHKEMIDKIAHKHAVADVKLKEIFVEGAIADAIGKTARELKADLLVVGTHSRSSFASFLLGSTASRVVTNSDMSVLVVKSKKHKMGLLDALSEL